MKRLGIIFNAIVLSALIVLVSCGVTLVHCNHTGNMSVAQFAVAASVMPGEHVSNGMQTTAAVWNRSATAVMPVMLPWAKCPAWTTP